VSQENIEIVRSTFEPFDGVNVAAIDWSADAIREALGRAYTPDIELTTWRQVSAAASASSIVENLDYIEAGECVLVPSRQWGIGAGSGARVEIELTTLYELRDGRIKRIHQYDSTEEALEAAGQRE
jgi:hypothetical protein